MSMLLLAFPQYTFLFCSIAFVNYIPLGPAVIEVGNNLHLILPDGAFPVPISSNSNPVTPVLTPINQVHTRALAIKQTYHPHAVTPMHPMQRCRLAAPVLIPAVARKPLLNSTFTSASLRSSSTISTVPQNSGQASAKVRTSTKPGSSVQVRNA